jgi:hypothetical protein
MNRRNFLIFTLLGSFGVLFQPIRTLATINQTPFRWQYHFKNKFPSDDGSVYGCWNSGWNRGVDENGGFFSGAYTGSGNLVIYKSDLNGENWKEWFKIKSKNYESVSSFIPNHDLTGMNVLTEQGDGCELRWFPDNDVRQVKLWKKFDPQYMYGFGAAGCVKQGWAAICGNRNKGGRLIHFDDGWKFFTPEFRDFDNWPMLIWDGIEFNGKIIVGGVRGHGQYHDVHGGRIGILENGNWIIKNLQPQGTAGILQFNTLSSDPGYLYMCTSYGEIWKTKDLEVFELVFTGIPFWDIRFYDVEGHAVCISAKGKVYDNYEEVIDLSNECEWMNFSQPKDRVGLLAGTFQRKGENGTYGITLSYN